MKQPPTAGHSSKNLEIRCCLEAAMQDGDGLSVGACLQTLGKLCGFVPEDLLLHTGFGIRFCDAFGAAQCAYAAAAQFLVLLAHSHGFIASETRALCLGWQRRYEDFSAALLSEPARGESEVAAGVLLLAQDYFAGQQLLARPNATPGMAKPSGPRRIKPEPQIPQQKEVVKPRQYYDGIYADRESMFKHSPYALEAKLSAAVTKGDAAAALGALRAISAQGEKAVLAKEPLRSAKNSMIGSIAFLARAAIQAGVNANHAFALSDAFTLQVEELGTRDTVLALEESILLQFIALVRKRLEGAYSPPIAKAVHYIENHMDGKLLLANAAHYAGVHPAYLSSRFKRETGQPFAAYVAARKVQESLYFIRHTDYSISQIALLYGFSSQSYYIAAFKKVLGSTPARHRRRFLAE